MFGGRQNVNTFFVRLRFFTIGSEDVFDLFADMFGGITRKFQIGDCIIEVSGAFSNIVFFVLNNNGGAFICFIYDYVIIFIQIFLRPIAVFLIGWSRSTEWV